jgi:hypothetical protein
MLLYIGVKLCFVNMVLIRTYVMKTVMSRKKCINFRNEKPYNLYRSSDITKMIMSRADRSGRAF